MRIATIAFRLAVAAAASTVISSPVFVAAAAPASPIAGTWKGPFLGSNFIFELKQSGNGWTGRYMSDKSRRWADLQNIAVTNGAVSFSFVSDPPSTFSFKVDGPGKTLNGSAKFGPHDPIPLTLTRAS